ncbi:MULTISPECIES: YeiH family protein [unclassified Modicisalibacter]|uniref:YeiH family protein n=1 Tax=unclassified Modicisalibacter TaxID=2679913 RepID=UPI001CCF5281|nr:MULTISPECIES: YeiH family protein [unclassified Modicisalibacter]MBZ9556757.1 YeiH family putative sulfate export transporter [Modicisalibacter sp. R2A 31.J]MBZ9574774.1 YeiH family putative sulfate export transporter [Modicisalibacter sp. MOD 31.J]
MWQGLILCAGLTLGGFTLAHLPGIRESGVSPLVFSLLLGLVVGNLPVIGHQPRARAGLQFATRRLLRGGIVLFGLSLTLQQILGLGPKVILLDTLVICSVLIVGYWVGTRLLGLDRETALLTSAGSAICGAAAVLATETTIRSKPAATSMAVATVVLFGSLAMLVYPLLYPLTGMDEGLFGIYIGATVHEVAQVVAAGDAVGPQALANAVIVKLVRVMLLVPFLLVVGQWWIRRQASEGNTEVVRGGLVIPWFAFGFLAMVVFNSLVTLPAPLHQSLVVIGQIALAMAMAALGFETRLEKLKALGVKPFLLALCLFAMLLAGGMLVTPLLMR